MSTIMLGNLLANLASAGSVASVETEQILTKMEFPALKAKVADFIRELSSMACFKV